jgi:hypothetical protein
LRAPAKLGTPPVGGSAYEKPQSDYGLCAVFFRYIWAAQNPSLCSHHHRVYGTNFDQKYTTREEIDFFGGVGSDWKRNMVKLNKSKRGGAKLWLLAMRFSIIFQI